VLAPVELADRAPELPSPLRIVGGGVDTPLRDTDGLRGQQYGGQVADAFRSQPVEPLLGRRLYAVEVELRDSAREVDARDFRGTHVGRIEGVPHAVDLADDDVGLAAAD